LYSLFFQKRKKKLKVNTSIGIFLIICFSLIGFKASAQEAGLSLQNAIDIALKQYPTVEQSVLQTRQQEALKSTATLMDPFTINSSFGQINSKVFDYNTGVGQGFKLPGSYQAEQNLLKQNVNVALANEVVTKNDLIKKVSESYYNWVYSQKHYLLLIKTDSLYLEYENYANKKYQLGESNKLEKINATLQRHELRIQLAEANTQLINNYTDLQTWMYTKQLYKAPVEFNALPEINLKDSSLVLNHPILQYIQQQILAKELSIQAEKAKRQVSFNVGVNAQSLERESLFYYGSIGINIPLFNNGVKARTQAAKIETEIAKIELDKTQQVVVNTFSQQLQLQKQFGQQLDYYNKEGLALAETVINAAQRSYKSGDIGYIEYIQNLNAAIKIKTEYLNTLNNYNHSVIQLQYLLNK
ncbi:MAG TPA: TolC family protein, partial [Saprospiraceae bacterium]|nr:TolC family protein [Saprospiraceae bacterium]